jgi:salicylate hydroxylase
MVATPEPKVFRVAVIGGGIGGLFCTLAIHHHCSKAGVPVEINVYEQAKEYKEIGAGIGIALNAARLAHRLGIGSQLNEIGAERGGVWFSFRRHDTSEDIITITLPGRGDVRESSCSRHDLLELLRRTTIERQAATLFTQKTCVRVEDHGGVAVVHFRDGSTATADLVIGCDGIHSTLRGQFAEDKPINSGQIAYRGLIPIAALKDWPFEHAFNVWVAKNRHFLTYPIGSATHLNIVAFVTKGKSAVAGIQESWTSICSRKVVQEDFADFDKPVQDIISLMDETPGRWLLNDREPLPRWNFFGGKVVLLGDAAHAMLPHMGAGAGQALEDGWILGRVLSDYLSRSPERCFVTLEASMQLYQDVRLPRAQKAQAASRVSGRTYQMQNEDMSSLSYEECLPILAETNRQRMKWIWEEDADVSYEKMRKIHEVA